MAENRRSGTKPPEHLSAESTRWWRDVVRDYALEPHHLRLLQFACEAWDRGQAARRELADFGSLTFVGPNGALRPHPAVAIERDSRISFARLLRELDLDLEPPADGFRAPALGSNRG